MNEMQSLHEKKTHEFRVISRRQMTIDGIKDVIGFDEVSVQLMTYSGEMTVEGSGLHVKTLDVERGIVVLEGKIDGVFYTESETVEKRGFWERLMK